MGRMTHADIESLLGAYALDALPDDEIEAVELHLKECPRCLAEVRDHREVAALLAHTGTDAPSGVWDRIAGVLEADPPALDMARVLPAVGHAPRRRASSPWSRRLEVTLVAASMFIAAVLGVEVLRQDGRLEDIQAAMAAERLSGAAAKAVLSPGAHKIKLQSNDGRVELAAVMLPSGEGYVVQDNLPALSRAETYQLWALVGGTTVSVGVLGADPDVIAFRAPADTTVLAVTVEKAGGVSVTQKSPLAAGTVVEA
jgi:anti-sigma factor RsiW